MMRLLGIAATALFSFAAAIAPCFSQSASSPGSEHDAVAAIKAIGGLTATSATLEMRNGKVALENRYDKPVALVYLEETKVTDEQLSLLKHFPELRRLDLTTTKISDAGMRHLRGLKKLEWLGLARTEITDKGLENLKVMAHLKTLYLRQTKVGDAGLAHLGNLKKLEELVLDSTAVTDDGLATLKDMTNLRCLSLDTTRTGDAGPCAFFKRKTISERVRCTLTTASIPITFTFTVASKA